MKQPQTIHPETLYSGRWRHTIDDSNRIMLPSDWRVKGAPDRFFVVLAPEGDHLLVCPPPVMGAFLEKLRGSTAETAVGPELERSLSERTRPVSLDRFGRLPLPREFTTKLGLKDHGELFGVWSRFEVWPSDKLETASARRTAADAIVNEQLKSLT